MNPSDINSASAPSVAASVEQRTREAGYYLMLRSAESVAALEGLKAKLEGKE